MSYLDDERCGLCGMYSSDLNFGQEFRYFNDQGRETLESSDPVCPDCVPVIAGKAWPTLVR